MDEVIVEDVPKVDGIVEPDPMTAPTGTEITTLPDPPEFNLTTEQLFFDIGFDIFTTVMTILISFIMYKIKKSLRDDNMLSTPISKMISRLGPLFVKIFTNIYKLIIKVKTGKEVKGTGVGIIVTDAVKETMEIKYKVEPNDADDPKTIPIEYDEYDVNIPNELPASDTTEIEYYPVLDDVPKVE